MKLEARQHVEGTSPTIHIGHRVYLDRRTGQPKVSRPWYAEYCLLGKQRWKALGTTNKGQAVREAHALCQRLHQGQTDLPRTRVTVKQVVDDYLELQRARGRAPKTIEKYELVTRNLLVWAGGNGDRLAQGLGEDDFWSFHRWLQKAGLKPKTCYDRLTIIKQVFKSAQRRRLIATNPFGGLSISKPESAQQPCFTPQQVGLLLSAADDHDRPIYAVMAYAGLRFGEVRDLQWLDLLLGLGEPGYIVVRRGGSGGTTKSRRVRRVPINPELRKLLDGLERKRDRVFSARPSKKHPQGDGPLNERRVLVALKRLCRRCHFVNFKQYKLHTFRHSFASMCARNNISYKYALEWMGHRSSDILDLYYTMFDDTAEAAMRSINYPTPAAKTMERSS